MSSDACTIFGARFDPDSQGMWAVTGTWSRPCLNAAATDACTPPSGSDPGTSETGHGLSPSNLEAFSFFYLPAC